MKKTIAFLAAVSMVMSLAACGGSAPAANSETAASPAADAGTASAAAPEASSAAGATSATEGAAVSVEGKTVAFIPKLTGNAFFEAANEIGRASCRERV